MVPLLLVVGGLIACKYSWLGLIPAVIGVAGFYAEFQYFDQRREEKRRLNRRQA